MKYNEIERLQQLAGIINEIKVNKPSSDPVDNYIMRKFKPTSKKVGKGPDGDPWTIYYLSDDDGSGIVPEIIYYPNNEYDKISMYGVSDYSKTNNDINTFINSLK